jgi:predicted Zn-dependent protease
MGGMSQIPTPRIKLAIQRAYDKWADVCGLEFKESSGSQDADILIITKRLDGPGGTLADAQLPPGDNRQLLMRLDNEAYTLTDNPSTGKQIDLGRVLLHEGGHTIGIGHLSSGNVMQPSYSRLVELELGDIKAAEFLYGKNTAPDDPDPDPKDIVIKVPAGATITISQKR